MRIRLQLLLPLAVGLLVGLGFLLAATLVGDAVRGSLTTVAGLTRERAVEAAVRAVVVAGILATLISVVASAVVARMIVVPLLRAREATRTLAEAGGRTATPVAEIQDVVQGLDRVAEELRDRHRQATRERSELAALVDAVSEGIVHLDPEARILRMNRAAHRLLGVPGEAAGRPLASLVRNREVRRLLDRGARGLAIDPAEVLLDDRRVLVAVNGQPEGGAVATLVDLTDLRRLEEVRRDFVANASHELKTPLTSIRGYTETLLEASFPPSEQRPFLLTIARNAERLQRIVDDLLDLSRLESGGWKPELEAVDLVDVARSSWGTFAERAAQLGVDFAVTADGDPLACADRRALEQVFSNLYDNALRYSPAGGRVSVRVVPRETGPEPGGGARWAGPGPVGDGGVRNGEGGGPTGEERWVQVDIADTGTGIPRDALPRIFERFYRVDPARSRAEGGTGLGLSIVRHMLERMGGAVNARSQLGKGTTIELWLPAAGKAPPGE